MDFATALIGSSFVWIARRYDSLKNVVAVSGLLDPKIAEHLFVRTCLSGLELTSLSRIEDEFAGSR